jgi:hypothetical protein
MTQNTGRIHQLLIMLLAPCECMIVKVWNHEEFDTDADGTKYHRGLILYNTDDPDLDAEPFKIKYGELPTFVTNHINSGWKRV